MIRSVSIHNFQSHHESKLEFDPGVNVILGPSDAGKSAIVRALSWVLYNRPLGDGYRTVGSDLTKVEVEFDDVAIHRVRGKTQNEYWLNDLKLTAFGQDPPEEILRAHNLDPSLNVQNQVDPFFLLQFTPGEVARYLNQIASLDEIDKLMKALDAHCRSIARSIDGIKVHQESLKKDLQSFEGLDAIGEAIEEAEAVECQLSLARKKRQDISALLGIIRGLERKIEEGRQGLKVKDPLRQALSMMEEIESRVQARSKLDRKITTARRLMNQISLAREKVERSKPVVLQALELMADYSKLEKDHSRVQSCLDRVASKAREIEQAKSRLEKLRARFVKEMPRVCPLCGQEVKSVKA